VIHGHIGQLADSESDEEKDQRRPGGVMGGDLESYGQRQGCLIQQFSF
jgi:hypothetical protein